MDYDYGSVGNYSGSQANNSPDGHVYISAAPAILDTSSKLDCSNRL